jgi:hypothetical protein
MPVMTFQEIASELGLPLHQVYALYRSALTKLKATDQVLWSQFRTNNDDTDGGYRVSFSRGN